MIKNNSTSKGYTLTGELVFPANSSRNSFFITSVSSTDAQIAFGNDPQAEDFIPLVDVNDHLAPIPVPTSRITITGTGAVVILSDNHITADNAPVRFIAQPFSSCVEAGEDATFSVVVNEPDTSSYQWQEFVDGEYEDLAGETDATLTTDVLGSYRVVVTNGPSTRSSQRASLTNKNLAIVYPETPIVSIEDAMVARGAVSIAATPTAGTFKWEVKTKQSGRFIEIAGEVAATLTFDAALEDDNNEYRVTRYVTTNGSTRSNRDTMKLRVGFQLGDRDGVEGDFTYTAGLATSAGLGNRATFSPGPFEAEVMADGSFHEGGDVYEGRNGYAITVNPSAIMINDGYPGSESGVNSSTFGIYLEPDLDVIDNVGYPNILFKR